MGGFYKSDFFKNNYIANINEAFLKWKQLYNLDIFLTT